MHVTHKSGHQSWNGEVFGEVFGEVLEYNLKLNDDDTVDFSLADIGNMCIKCAWCGRVIPTGSAITLCTPAEPDFKTPEDAVVYKEEPLLLVGCTRMDCCISGGTMAGYWAPNTEEPKKEKLVSVCVLLPNEQALMQFGRVDDSTIITDYLSGKSE